MRFDSFKQKLTSMEGMIQAFSASKDLMSIKGNFPISEETDHFFRQFLKISVNTYFNWALSGLTKSLSNTYSYSLVRRFFCFFGMSAMPLPLLFGDCLHSNIRA